MSPLAGAPGQVTPGPPHVRDSLDLRTVMGWVIVALVPSLLMGLYNTGYQANHAMRRLGVDAAPGWRGVVLDALGTGYDPASVWACTCHGLVYFLPIYLTSTIVTVLWLRAFAMLRGRGRGRGTGDGAMVTALLFTLTLPPTLPPWQAALGISFGVVIAREIFGGTGKNFLNPALAALAFLYFTYPDDLRGAGVWTPVDGFTGATSLTLAARGGIDAIQQAGIAWADAFVGRVPGALGGTSALASLLGGLLLIHTRAASWRVVAGVVAGAVATALAFNVAGSEFTPAARLPWYWHLTLGSFAFGTFFFATDPVTAAMTDAGRWIYGGLIGSLVVLIRVANPIHPEGVMLAILLGNVFAPAIDAAVVWTNIRRRAQRSES